MFYFVLLFAYFYLTFILLFFCCLLNNPNPNLVNPYLQLITLLLVMSYPQVRKLSTELSTELSTTYVYQLN